MPTESVKSDDQPTATPADPAPSLPHDRDERPVPDGANAAHAENRKTAEQAHRDVESDVIDTERIGIPSHVPSADDNRR